MSACTSRSLRPVRSFLTTLAAFGLALGSTTAIAQTIAPSAVQQIQALMAEKEARTPAQLKVDSQLHYASRMAQGAQIADGVRTITVAQGAQPDAQGMVLVDITANVTPDLLNQISVLGGQVLTAKDLEALSKLPSREVLLAQLLGVLQGVPTALVTLLAGVIRNLLNVLVAYRDKRAETEGTGAAPEAKAEAIGEAAPEAKAAAVGEAEIEAAVEPVEEAATEAAPEPEGEPTE